MTEQDCKTIRMAHRAGFNVVITKHFVWRYQTRKGAMGRALDMVLVGKVASHMPFASTCVFRVGGAYLVVARKVQGGCDTLVFVTILDRLSASETRQIVSV